MPDDKCKYNKKTLSIATLLVITLKCKYYTLIFILIQALGNPELIASIFNLNILVYSIIFGIPLLLATPTL